MDSHKPAPSGSFTSFWDAARFTNWLHNGQPTGPQGPGTTEDGAYHDVGDQTLFGRNAGAKFFIPTEDEWYKAARTKKGYANYVKSAKKWLVEWTADEHLDGEISAERPPPFFDWASAPRASRRGPQA